MLANGLFIGVGCRTIGELTYLSRGEQIVGHLIAIACLSAGLSLQPWEYC